MGISSFPRLGHKIEVFEITVDEDSIDWIIMIVRDLG